MFVFKQQWWSSLTLYVLEVFADDLMLLGLYEAIRATCFGISISIPTFYAILEMYCPVSGTFFTPVNELEMALHEMWEVSNFPMGSLPYEEYFLCAEELAQLRRRNRPFTRHIESSCTIFTYVSTFILAAELKIA